jgi:hypothetical protein
VVSSITLSPAVTSEIEEEPATDEEEIEEARRSGRSYPRGRRAGPPRRPGAPYSAFPALGCPGDGLAPVLGFCVALIPGWRLER